MATEPDPDDDHWRSEIVERMNKAGCALERIESDDPYPVEPGSDLAGDREQVPDIFTDTLATRRLKVAVDNLAGLRELVNNGVHFYAPFTLLRAVIESASVAVWLLEPADRKTRLQRVIGAHIEDTNTKKAPQAMIPEEFRDTFDHNPGIKRMVADSGSPRGKCKMPDMTSMLREIEDLPGDPGSLLLAWRVASGVAHGLSWATVGLLPGTNREQIGPTLHRFEAAPNYQLVSNLTSTAVRTIERAHCWFEVRRTVELQGMRPKYSSDDAGATTS